ncbi:hypothetical protein JQ604_14850 [Bradyrhizobium jicamae]|uniref:hypothetical protein n=1 Tax=Bradyrhizobium jicamae TaxID=280332 RepID=UPI001BAB034B|nr:hypothetical protein [Bradyrhizobium jicamae]MBR0753464.1 hypothetical protein [Bradyrhizobium jicamae]
MRSGNATKAKLGVWQCLEQLAREKNPRLVALIEIGDARHLLDVRAALEDLASGVVGKAKVARARKLLAHK